MRRARYFVLLCFAVCGICLASNVYASDVCAQGADKSCGMKVAGGGREKMRQELNLTEEQKQLLNANREKSRAAMKESFEKIKSCKEALKAELMKPQLDMAKISGIQSQIKALQSAMTDNRLNSILEVRKILSPEQFAKFVSRVDERMKHNRRSEKTDKR